MSKRNDPDVLKPDKLENMQPDHDESKNPWLVTSDKLQKGGKK